MVVFRHGTVRLVGIDMGVHERRGHRPRLEPGPGGEQVQQQRVAGDVVGEAEREVATALGEMEVEPADAVRPVAGVQDEREVAGRESARPDILRRPGAHHQPAGHRVALQLVEHPADLVGGPGRTREAPPEMAVRARHEAFVVRPGIPEPAAVFLQQGDRGFAGEEPEVFDDDVLPTDLLGGEQRETVGEGYLVVQVEDREGVHPGAVRLPDPGIENPANGVEVSLHRPGVTRRGAPPLRRAPRRTRRGRRRRCRGGA